MLAMLKVEEQSNLRDWEQEWFSGQSQAEKKCFLIDSTLNGRKNQRVRVESQREKNEIQRVTLEIRRPTVQMLKSNAQRSKYCKGCNFVHFVIASFTTNLFHCRKQNTVCTYLC
jgi:hypothetical protein